MARKAPISTEKDETEEAVDMINATVNRSSSSSSSSSARKRKAEPNQSEVLPNKRKAAEPMETAANDANANGRSPIRRSKRISGENPSIDGDHMSDNGGSVSNEVEAAQSTTKMKSLKRKAVPNPSPFKGQGVVDTSTNENVNLKDSPLKNKNPQQSKHAKNASRRADETRAKRRPAAGTKKRNRSTVMSVPQQQEGTQKNTTEKQTRSKSTKSGETEDQALLITGRNHQKQIEEQSKDKPEEQLEEQSEDQSDEEFASAAESPGENGEDEEAQNRKHQVEELIESVRGILPSNDCLEAYTKVMDASVQLQALKYDRELENDQCRMLLKRFHRIRRTVTEPLEKQLELQKKFLQSLKEANKALDESLKASGQIFAEQVMFDYSSHLVPNAVGQLNSLLSHICTGGEQSRIEYKVILKILSIILEMTQKVWEWQSQHERTARRIESVMELVKVIQEKLKIVKDSFKAGLERLEELEKRASFEERQQRDWQSLMEKVERRRAEIRQRHHQFINPPQIVSGLNFGDLHVTTQQRRSHAFNEVVDVDEFDHNSSESSIDRTPLERRYVHTNGRHQKGYDVTYGQAPRLERENTEEIPVPRQSNWSQIELAALLNGLQQFTSVTRFENILDTYGGPNDVLAGRDLDELMLQAQFIKESMTSQLKHKLDGSWDWLRSVPN